MAFFYLMERGCVVARLTGVLTLGDVVRSAWRLGADPAYDAGQAGMLDLREATTEALPRDVTALAKFFRERRRSRGRWVVLVNDPRLTAMCILFARATEGSFRMVIVSSWEAGCEWLGEDVREGVLRDVVTQGNFLPLARMEGLGEGGV